MEPQEYDDCDPGYCPKCLDVCLEEEGLPLDGITVREETLSGSIAEKGNHDNDIDRDTD